MLPHANSSKGNDDVDDYDSHGSRLYHSMYSNKCMSICAEWNTVGLLKNINLAELGYEGPWQEDNFDAGNSEEDKHNGIVDEAFTWTIKWPRSDTIPLHSLCVGIASSFTMHL